jgi:5'-deoxynucleotidase
MRAGDADDAYLHELVKAADKLSAYIKCLEEESSGNAEFRTAATSTLAALEEMRVTHPEVGDFMDEFLPSYGRTLDELL